ncbi:hypothetical protein IV203_030989 [Nitzschia inconspicua]|uniref:DUF6824 domain-containing protein n=1 Tax=Nitzschia inconspicua TaxID=303405 RepID=A0A9K3P834_9STRA|nr:hypothetical protein IV203_011185 [Nitzschia inconspicua]KAG7368246.1 hypothetical protein IV203_030989 [Nitzschia inconspicua]
MASGESSAASSVASRNSSSAAASSSTILSPSPNDVVGGRGKNTRLHPGNLFYTQLLKNCYEEYKEAPKGTKVDICKKIISIVAEHGGRFLEKALSSASSIYIELEEDRAIAKVAQGFRDLKVSKEGSRSEAAKALASISETTTAVKSKAGLSTIVARPIKRSKTSLPKAAHNATLPNQPRRLSFTERLKLFQKEQEKLMQRQRGDGTSSEEEEGCDDVDEEEEVGDELEQEDCASDSNDEDQKPSSQTSHPSNGDGGDVSETETEDSFPMNRGAIKANKNSKDENSDEDDL